MMFLMAVSLSELLRSHPGLGFASPGTQLRPAILNPATDFSASEASRGLRQLSRQKLSENTLCAIWRATTTPDPRHGAGRVT
jgi:hypothetical protein